MKANAGAVLSVLLAATGVAAAQDRTEIYRSQAIVTGTGEVNWRLGLALCLEDVLVKISGDPRLIGDPRVVRLSRRAAALVRTFRYRDRLEGRPIRDEQGTRDRPHDLTVDFDAAKIDAELARSDASPGRVSDRGSSSSSRWTMAPSATFSRTTASAPVTSGKR